MPINNKFRKKIKLALNNHALRKTLGNFAHSYPEARQKAYQNINFENLREEVEKIKSSAVNNIDKLADRFQQKAIESGAIVHRAKDGEQVSKIISDIARQRNAKLCVKSKSMATEEIHLNQRLQHILKVVETDLGEWIIQQINESPSHMVMPAIHLSKEKCAKIFSNVLGENIQPDIKNMVKLARKILREKFLNADIGISGCNIAVAGTGTMVLFTNEGNARLTSTLPPVHIIIFGYEKFVATFKEIAPLAAAIPRSATCQPITSYVTMISGPSETFIAPGENKIVNKELHIILLDNGRLELLSNPIFKKVGQCIRCASCLNVCPVYTLVGGQVFGHVYAGGIGALLTTFLDSMEAAEKIQELCLNCGKCKEMCPGKIDIPGLILEIRSLIRGQIPPPLIQKFIFEKMLPHKKMIDISVKASKPCFKGLNLFKHHHFLPPPASQNFREIFKSINQEITFLRGSIGFFYGCMIDYLYPEIGESIVSILNQCGYQILLPHQICCGAPALYMGLEKTAQKMAQKNLTLMENPSQTYEEVVTACPTGTVSLKKYWQLQVSQDPNVLEQAKIISEKSISFIQLVHRLHKQGIFQIISKTGDEKVSITYHYSCHLKRNCMAVEEPREVLTAIPGVKWIEMEGADQCCGFAGSYCIKLPEISSELLKQKISNIKKTNADFVIVDCPGCLFQLRRGLEEANSKIKVFHSAVFLAGYIK